jgi:MFS superfamily sulfate permease-like transporter
VSSRVAVFFPGLVFGVPMPVQPMKAIASVAITPGDPLTVPQIMAAGITTAAVLVFLGITGLMTVVTRWVPLSVVRGIQLSQGISFSITACKYILINQALGGGSGGGGARSWVGLDGKLLAIAALLFIVIVSGVGEVTRDLPQMEAHNVERMEHLKMADGKSHSEGNDLRGESKDPELGSSDIIVSHTEIPEKMEEKTKMKKSNWIKSITIPTALLVFVLGVVLAFIRQPSIGKQLRVGPSTPHVMHISRRDWRIGFVRAAIPQIPLSVLNSVFAVCKLSQDLFPSQDAVSSFNVSISVGLMNLVGCWFGAMPACHGAGGLAGQYRFGARSGFSVVFLGTAKLLLGLLLGSSLIHILSKFPVGLLGVLLLFAGLELAMACRDQNTRTDAFVMLVVTVVSLTDYTSYSSAIGFGCGMVAAILLRIRETKFWEKLCRLMPWMSQHGSTEQDSATQY